MALNSKTALLTGLMKEHKKEFYTYNVLGKTEFVYEAPEGARNGDPCLVTQYSYDAFGRPQKMKESEGVWNSLYDI